MMPTQRVDFENNGEIVIATRMQRTVRCAMRFGRSLGFEIRIAAEMPHPDQVSDLTEKYRFFHS